MPGITYCTDCYKLKKNHQPRFTACTRGDFAIWPEHLQKKGNNTWDLIVLENPELQTKENI